MFIRFGGNNTNSSSQNLSANIRDLQISDPPADQDTDVLPKLQLLHGASVSDGVLTLKDFQYADLSASVLGDWGTNDFELSLDIKTYN